MILEIYHGWKIISPFCRNRKWRLSPPSPRLPFSEFCAVLRPFASIWILAFHAGFHLFCASGSKNTIGNSMHWTKAPFTCFCLGIHILVGWTAGAPAQYWFLQNLAIVVSFAKLTRFRRTKLRIHIALSQQSPSGGADLKCRTILFPRIIPFMSPRRILSSRKWRHFEAQFLSVRLLFGGVFFLGWPCRNFMWKWTWSRISSSPFRILTW